MARMRLMPAWPRQAEAGWSDSFPGTSLISAGGVFIRDWVERRPLHIRNELNREI